MKKTFVVALMIAFSCLTQAHEFGKGIKQYDFMLGNWQGVTETLVAKGEYKKGVARYENRLILDGKGYESFYYGTESQGVTIHIYNPKNDDWAMSYNSIQGDKGHSSAFSAQIEEGVLVERFTAEDERGKYIGKAFYSDIQQNSFRYAVSISYDDGKTWYEVWRIHAKRES